MDPLTQVVGNLGFPIAAYLLMYRLVTTTLDRNTQALASVDRTLEDLRVAVVSLSREKDTNAR